MCVRPPADVERRWSISGVELLPRRREESPPRARAGKLPESKIKRVVFCAVCGRPSEVSKLSRVLAQHVGAIKVRHTGVLAKKLQVLGVRRHYASSPPFLFLIGET